jgi:hypothetical protein
MSDTAEEKRNCTVGICPHCERVIYARAPIDDEDEREMRLERKRLARDVGRLIRDGIRIETWDAPAVRAARWGCKCREFGRVKPTQSAQSELNL